MTGEALEQWLVEILTRRVKAYAVVLEVGDPVVGGGEWRAEEVQVQESEGGER